LCASVLHRRLFPKYTHGGPVLRSFQVLSFQSGVGDVFLGFEFRASSVLDKHSTT
jgi:hypothetical protein